MERGETEMSKNNKHKVREIKKKQGKGILRFIFFGGSLLFMPLIMIFLLMERRLKMSYINKIKGLWRVQLEILDGDWRTYKK